MRCSCLCTVATRTRFTLKTPVARKVSQIPIEKYFYALIKLMKYQLLIKVCVLYFYWPVK